MSSIAKGLPGIDLMATGGIDSADVTMQFIQAGAGLMQICSAVQNQDFTVVDDYISGLKWQLYMHSRSDLKDAWDGQTLRKAPKKVGEEPDAVPRFGVYELERRARRKEAGMKIEEMYSSVGASQETNNGEPVVQGKVPSVNDMIGAGLKHVKAWTELDITAQVVAQVDEDACINCGKCYMACNDSVRNCEMTREKQNCVLILVDLL